MTSEPTPVEGRSDEVSQFVATACFVPLGLSLLFVLLQPYVFVPLFVLGLPAAVISGEAIRDPFQRRWSTALAVYILGASTLAFVAELGALLLWWIR